MGMQKYSVSLSKKPPYGRFYSSPLQELETPVQWYAIDMIGHYKGVNAFIKLIKEKIQNDPFFGIYKMIDARNTEKTPRLYLYMEMTEKVNAWLNSDKAGATVIKKAPTGTETIPAKPVPDEVMKRYYGQVAGEGNSLLKKALTGESQNIRFSDMANIVNKIQQQNIRIVEYSNVLINSLNIDGVSNTNIWKFSISIGYLCGFATEIDIQESIESGRFSLNPITLIKNPEVTNSATIEFPNLENSPNMISPEKLEMIAEVVERRAKEYAEKIIKGTSHTELYTASEELRKKADDDSGEDVNIDSFVGSQSDIPFTSSNEDDIEPEEVATEKDTINKNNGYYIKDYRLVFGKGGVLSSVDIDIVINDTAEPTLRVNLWDDPVYGAALKSEAVDGKYNGKTLSGVKDLITPEGFNFIIDTIANKVSGLMDKAPFILKGSSQSSPKAITLNKRNNGEDFYKIHLIDVKALVDSNVSDPEEFAEYFKKLFARG